MIFKYGLETVLIQRIIIGFEAKLENCIIMLQGQLNSKVAKILAGPKSQALLYLKKN